MKLRITGVYAKRSHIQCFMFIELDDILPAQNTAESGEKHWDSSGRVE